MTEPKNHSVWLASSLVFASILMAGCAKSILIKPNLAGRDCKSDYDKNLWTCKVPVCTGLQTMGEACGSPVGPPIPPGSTKTWPDNITWVGWGDRYKPGSGACPCWEWVSTMSHGYVKFDVSPLQGKKIESATLAWRKSTIESGDGSVATNLPDPASCVRYLLEATGPWKADATPATVLFGDLDQHPDTELRNVAKVVKKWVDTGQNHGFMFTPKRNWTESKSNNRCTNSLHDFELFVRYRD